MLPDDAGGVGVGLAGTKNPAICGVDCDHATHRLVAMGGLEQHYERLIECVRYCS